MRWQDIENEKEKYAAYLCSREWCEKREAVRERAKDKCERCHVLPMNACHHLTYKRKYNERLEDLQAICTLCHEFTHGKNGFDPLENKRWLDYLSHCAANNRTPVPMELAHFGDGPSFISSDEVSRRLAAFVFIAKHLYSQWLQFRDLALLENKSPFYEGLEAYYGDEMERFCCCGPFNYLTWTQCDKPTVRGDYYLQTLDLFGLEKPQDI